jgi:hypothetical protein
MDVGVEGEFLPVGDTVEVKGIKGMSRRQREPREM